MAGEGGPDGDSNLPSNTFIISDGKQLTEKVINQRDINIQGQTSGEWVYLGEFEFAPGKKNYVEVTSKNAGGIVIADAILLLPNRRTQQ